MEEDYESGESFENAPHTECLGATARSVTSSSSIITRGPVAAPTPTPLRTGEFLTMPTHTNTRATPSDTVQEEAGGYYPTTETFIHTVTRPSMSTGATSREHYPGTVRIPVGPLPTTPGLANNTYIPNEPEHSRAN